GGAEMGPENGHIAVGIAGAERPARRPRHGLIVTEVAVPVGLAALDGMMHEIAGNDGLAPLRANAQAYVTGGVPGRRLEHELVADLMISLDQVGPARLHHRPHAIGDDRPVLVAVARGPVLPFLPREEIAGAWEGRHPAAVLEPRVPADVIHVEVGAQDEMAGFGGEAGGAQALEEVRALHVPVGVLAGLVVADARVDEDGEAGRLHDEAVDAHEEASALVEEVGGKPVAMAL